MSFTTNSTRPYIGSQFSCCAIARKTSTCRVCATCCAASLRGLETGAIDIDEPPRQRPEAGLLEAFDPRLRQRVLDPVDAATHRRVRGDDLGHARIELVAL